MEIRAKLREILTTVQVDVGQRGLGRVPGRNLFTACPEDFADACLGLAQQPAAHLAIVTGFWIASAGRAETDGPLGAIFLARTLPHLGIAVSILAEPFCLPSLKAGLNMLNLQQSIPLRALPVEPVGCTHLLALERAGPSHTRKSLKMQPSTTPEVLEQFEREVPPESRGRCHSMRGQDISAHMEDVSVLFSSRDRVTLGIGDGGNEIGMGKVPWQVVRDNIPLGGQLACGVPVDHLIVAGISNWGAYALASGVAMCRGHSPSDSWFDVSLEQALLKEMVTRGNLVDGVTGQASVSVDGVDFAEYCQSLVRIGCLLGRKS